MFIFKGILSMSVIIRLESVHFLFLFIFYAIDFFNFFNGGLIEGNLPNGLRKASDILN